MAGRDHLVVASADLSTPGPGPRRDTAFVLTVVVVLLIPFVGLPRADERLSVPLELSYLYAADAALVALTLLAAPRIARSALRVRTAEEVSWVALFAFLAIAFVVHPSASGIDVVLRLAAAVALYRVIADLDGRRRRIVAAALGVTAVAQACVAVLQVATGAPLGLRALGELDVALSTYHDGPPLARGTLGHEFILAALALVAASALVAEAVGSRSPGSWLVAGALSISSTGLVYGRTVALALGLVWASLVPGALRDAVRRRALLALVVGAAVPGLILADGWASSFARGVGTDRGGMIEQALAIVAADPVAGVGPGRYLEVLRARPELLATRRPQDVHDVPAMIAAEAGVPAGVIAAALLVLVGRGALRAGTSATSLYLAYVPWMVVDVLPYDTPQGIVITALWLGLLRAHRTEARGPRVPAAT